MVRSQALLLKAPSRWLMRIMECAQVRRWLCCSQHCCCCSLWLRMRRPVKVDDDNSPAAIVSGSHARLRASIDGLDEGEFTEGHKLPGKWKVAKEMVGRRLSQEEAKKLLGKFE